ncbi:MAG: glycosyltransferase family 2 protein [Acidimicrobiaceae bacterium]|nr:glycosyltransferase family 2 protein [Acidimicrobiaceae bacterium]
MTPEQLADAFARTCVVIPAYNEGKSIQAVIRAVQEHMPGAIVVVVNDGSSDDTEVKARAVGAVVLSLSVNLGIGGAVQTGYKFALRRGYDFAVQIDGDGQHDPREVPHLFEQLIEEESDLVIGSRWLGRGEYVAPRNRRFAMKFLQALVSWRARGHFTDTTSGFRALNRRTIELFAIHYPTDYPEVESIVLARKFGLRVTEVPVKMEAREHGTSSIRGFKTLYFMIRVTVGLLVGVMGGEEL